MDETMNAVINNLGDRLGDVFEAVGPIAKSVGSISQTVVQETASAGFFYTMVGLAILTFGVVCFFLYVTASKELRTVTSGEGTQTLSDYSRVLVMGMVCSFILGLWVSLSNLGIWVAPTREVIREIAENI